MIQELTLKAKSVNKAHEVKLTYEIVESFTWNGEVYLKIQEKSGNTSGYKWVPFNSAPNKSSIIKEHRGY